MLNKAETPRSSVQMYADAARMTPTSMSSQSSSVARSATPEPVFCTVDTSRVSEDHISDAILMMIHKTVEGEMQKSNLLDCHKPAFCLRCVPTRIFLSNSVST
jgi:hypothetical protein